MPVTVNPVKVHELANRPRPVPGARQLEALRQRLGDKHHSRYQ